MSVFISALAALALVLVYEGITGAPPLRSFGLVRGLDDLARAAGFTHATGVRMIAASLLLGATTLVIVAGSTSSLVPALAFSLAAAWSPIAVARARVQKRRRRLGEAWPDAIATIISGVRAGVSLSESCASVATRGPEYIRPGFIAFGATLRASGSFPAALERLRQVLADPIADRVATALALAHEVGGSDLVRVLRTLGDFVRDDLRVRKEIEARWSWTVTAARVAAAAPWIVLLLMSTRPEAAAAYDSSAGALVIGGGAAATVLGYRLMLRAGRLPEERRLGA
ncbi:MAG: type II secretion system F family protein [Actinomycetota bacterium]